MSYIAASLIQVQATFTDSTNVVPVDPTVVSLTVENGLGQVEIYLYGSEDNFITRQTKGIYTAVLDTTLIPGVWTYQWQGSGNIGQAVDFGRFVVQNAPIPTYS